MHHNRHLEGTRRIGPKPLIYLYLHTEITTYEDEAWQTVLDTLNEKQGSDDQHTVKWET